MDTLLHRPHLTPDQPPKWYPDIHKCIKCDARYGFDNNGMFWTSCVLTQDSEGWFRVICAECGNEGMGAASGETAIKLWNEINDTTKLLV